METKTELHLDADEWATILLALKYDRDNGAGGASYREYLDMIILKIEAALQ